MAIFTVNITRIMIRMIVIVMMSVALASDPCGAQIILLRLLLLLMMMMMIGTNGALPVFWTDALGKVALNGETLKLVSVCGSEVN